MKLAVVVLVVLGLLAAGSAAFLFQWIQVRSAAQAGPQGDEVPVLVAQSDLPARMRLTEEHVVVVEAARTGLPAGYFGNPAQAIGKTLKMEVAKGQALTPSCFLPENAIDNLLKPGMLAFQISLTRRSTAVDLLYPGCVVDVFATFPLRDRDKGEAVVIPLLQNMQVLAVRDETVVTAAQDQDGKNPVSNATTHRGLSSSGNVTVALAVTSRQAAALQLAIERGTLGLAMRNPLDKNWNPMEPMVVKEGQLTAASEAMDPQTLALFSRIQQMLGEGPVIDPNGPLATTPAQLAGTGADPNTLRTPMSALPAMPTPEYVGALQQKRTTSKVDVIRGQKREEVELEVRNEPNEVEAALEEGGS